MEPNHLKILLVENEPEFAGTIQAMLNEAAGGVYKVTVAENFAAGLARLSESGFDLMLIDLSVPDGGGLANLEGVKAVDQRVPVIVLGHVEDEAVALEAVHGGAQDYLLKSQLNSQLLSRAIRYAIERQHADAALLEAERKYRGIFEHIVEGIFQTTPDGHYLSANSALARIYGYGSPEELISNIQDIGRTLYVDAGRRAEFVQLMKELDTVTDFESRIYRKDGSTIWIAENVRAIRDWRGELLYYEGTVEDITQRRLAEEKVRDSEALYHSLVETLPQNIFRKDRDGHFTFVNQRFCQTVGRSAAEILGKTDFDLFPPELAVKYKEDDRSIMESNEAFETVEENQPTKGETIYVHVVKTPLRDAKGNVVGLQGIFWDISRRIRAEEQARKATEELARSREALRKRNEQMEEDLKMAREIQQTMLPQFYPSFPKDATSSESLFRFCHRYHPTGAVGGDYFNVLALSDTAAGVFICDVMGHGVRSALVAAMVRALVEELKPLGNDPGAFLTQLNRDLCAILKHTGSPTLTTAFYLVADAQAGQFRYANAGHPKPILIRRNSGVTEPLANVGNPKPALGLFEGAVYTTSQRPMQETDMVMLFTDGLYEVEGANQQFYSAEMLLQAARRLAQLPAGELFDKLLAEIKEFALDQEFTDDVCVVGVEVAPRK